jgi:hypothetical protein
VKNKCTKFSFRVPSVKSANNLNEQMIQNKRNSTASSLFLSSLSSTSAFSESNDYDQNEDMDLFPQLNTIKPRLMMQISHQLQH